MMREIIHMISTVMDFREKMMIQETRIQKLNSKGLRTGGYVLYWMQQSQRAEYNHALEYAVGEADRQGLPVVVVFGLTDGYPEANLRHYTFMLEGLKETRAALADRGIRMAVQQGEPVEVALQAGRNAALIVCDRGYLRHQVSWRKNLAEKADCALVQVESDVVAPVEIVSPKAEYAARTFRPKIHKHLDDYLVDLSEAEPRQSSLHLDLDGIDPGDTAAIISEMSLDRDVSPVSVHFKGGTGEAKRRFREFIENRLERYSENSNQPQTDDISHMSPYLHFGQISPLYLALKIKAVEKDFPEASADYLEELLVRRELAINFVHYTPDYDRFGMLPGWARETLLAHKSDDRPHRYTRKQMENAETHDPYWNAAMKEMRHTGFMHNYMRMYWGKKVLEWCNTPEYAYETLLYLNNKYFLDGRDPASYANVGWIFGLHDRAWKERPIFGKVRYMAASGLERKCDIDGYVKKVEERMARHSDADS